MQRKNPLFLVKFMVYFFKSNCLTGRTPDGFFTSEEEGVLEPAEDFGGSTEDLGEELEGGDEGGKDLEEGKLELPDPDGSKSCNAKVLCVRYQLLFMSLNQRAKYISNLPSFSNMELRYKETLFHKAVFADG